MARQGFTGNQLSGGGGPVALTSRHILGMEGMSPNEIRGLLDRGHIFADNPHGSISDALRGKTIINLFYESSTRTRVSFELAAKRLGGSVLNIAASH